MDSQRPLVGQYRFIVEVASSGTVHVHLIHRPHPESTFGSKILSTRRLEATDDELIDGDWGALLDRALGAALYGVF